EQLPWAPRPVPQEASPTDPGTTATPSTTPRTANPRNLDPDVPYVPLALPQKTADWVRPVAIGVPVLLVVAVLLVAPALLRAGQRRWSTAPGSECWASSPARGGRRASARTGEPSRSRSRPGPPTATWSAAAVPDARGPGASGSPGRPTTDERTARSSGRCA